MNMKCHHMSSQMKLKEIPLLFDVSNRTNTQTDKHTNRQTDKLFGSIVCRNIGHSSEWQLIFLMVPMVPPRLLIQSLKIKLRVLPLQTKRFDIFYLSKIKSTGDNLEEILSVAWLTSLWHRKSEIFRTVFSFKLQIPG